MIEIANITYRDGNVVISAKGDSRDLQDLRAHFTRLSRPLINEGQLAVICVMSPEEREFHDVEISRRRDKIIGYMGRFQAPGVTIANEYDGVSVIMQAYVYHNRETTRVLGQLEIFAKQQGWKMSKPGLSNRKAVEYKFFVTSF